MSVSANILALRAQQVLARMNRVGHEMARDVATNGDRMPDLLGEHYALDCELDGIIDALAKEVA